jgi:hypothetical protein
MSRPDPFQQGLDYLLDLDRETYEIGGGWWVTFRACRVEQSEGRPHESSTRCRFTILVESALSGMTTRMPRISAAHSDLWDRPEKHSITGIIGIDGVPMNLYHPPTYWRISGGMLKRS